MYSTGRVGTPSRRSVPGVLPESVEAMSMMSSEIWKAIPTARPYRRSAAISSSRAPENIPAYRAQVSISAAVFSSSTRRWWLIGSSSGRGPDRFPGLPGDQLGERLGDDPHRVRPETRRPAGRRARTGSRRSGSRSSCPSGRWRTWPRGAGPPRPSRRRGTAWPGGSARRRRTRRSPLRRPGCGPTPAATRVNSGRNRLPPACIRCDAASVTKLNSLISSRSSSSSTRARPDATLADRSGSASSMPASMVGAFTRQ